ncbi:uncharacterized protein LOC117294001 [Asterias rubens]|uniref:uncharacterized protein LOC117294001 n=1 Tax=Asterias rubens TaxID=7604 RepID=UPI001455445B|nr:uncharacterized protein LOC117294001 [Asterias rubens]
MDLQLHTKLIVVQGFILIMLASVTEQSIPTIVERDPEEWKCDPPCDNNLGMFCLLRQCIPCGLCPQDPFDLDQTGHLDIYKPCIQNGFCPRVCSSYLNLGSYPLANETFCEEIKAPKVTTPQPTIEEVVITTTANSTTGVTSTKAGDTTAKNPDDITYIDKNGNEQKHYYFNSKGFGR